MPATIISTPIAVVSVFGDSWSSYARLKPEGYIKNPIASIGAGLGYVASGPNYVLDNFSYGGTSADNAVNGTGNFALAIGSPGMSFAAVVNEDSARYQVFRYGINDVVQFLPSSANPSSAEVSAMAAVGLNAAGEVSNATLWANTKANFRNTMVSRFTSLVNSSLASGRKPVLATMPTLSTHNDGGFRWTQGHVELLAEVTSAAKAVVTAKNIRLVDQSSWFLAAGARYDAFHLNNLNSHLTAVDFGQKLRVALAGY